MFDCCYKFLHDNNKVSSESSRHSSLTLHYAICELCSCSCSPNCGECSPSKLSFADKPICYDMLCIVCENVENMKTMKQNTHGLASTFVMAINIYSFILVPIAWIQLCWIYIGGTERSKIDHNSSFRLISLHPQFKMRLPISKWCCFQLSVHP